jgi:hypothetical protein
VNASDVQQNYRTKKIQKWYQDLLLEILEERVLKRDGRRNQRCRKRVKSKYETKKINMPSLPRIVSVNVK